MTNFNLIELLNLCDAAKFKMLFDWDGSALSVQHLKLDLVSHNMLQRLKQATTTESEATTSSKASGDQMETA